MDGTAVVLRISWLALELVRAVRHILLQPHLQQLYFLRINHRRKPLVADQSYVWHLVGSVQSKIYSAWSTFLMQPACFEAQWMTENQSTTNSGNITKKKCSARVKHAFFCACRSTSRAGANGIHRSTVK